MSFGFVDVKSFTPNNDGWSPIGNISATKQAGNTFELTLQDNPELAIQISFLSPVCFRIRFNPSPGFDFAVETSVAVVNRALGAVRLDLSGSDPTHLVVDTGQLKVVVSLNPYQIQVFRGNQLISQDMPGKNLVYIPGQEVIANFKAYPANALYFGFGEKAGSTLVKNNYTMTFFNFDNFTYNTGIIPPMTTGGPLNPSEPLYASVPLLLEVNPDPTGQYQGAPYAIGIFLDNPAQSYFNIGASDYSDMFGKYYFGALYGDLDYYFMAGNDVRDVVAQYTTLTGRSQMPPKYVFGFHQGCYGYFDSTILNQVAQQYRAAKIPIDGLHIDVDFQDNYRTFTSSQLKFPNAPQLMADLRTKGFKCSTNITPLLTQNTLNENGEVATYTQRESLQAINGLIFDTMSGQGPNPTLFTGTVSYGVNPGSNPFPVPPLMPNNDGLIPLQATGNYPDLGRADVQAKWGQQYQYLIQTVGIDMIWQDMTDPALVTPLNPMEKTFPLGLQVSNGATFVPHAKVHNAYALNLLKATTQGLSDLRPTKRNFIIARGGYAGMQRYAALWTGDSASSWDFLRINIPQVLNLGMSGIPLSGTDIGGFANGSISPAETTQSPYLNGNKKIMEGITNYELLTRWMQLGAFLPWYRNHYNGYTKQFQEPYAYQEPVPTHCRKYIELRYRLVQLWYDAMYNWTQTGVPIVRPLFMNDPQDLQAYNNNYLNDQFFLGKDMLVAPILTQHETLPVPTPPLRDIYLPAGGPWYAFKDNQSPLEQSVQGGTVVKNYYADLSLMPVYIRGGAILPTRELEQYIGQLQANPLTFNIYPGSDDSYTLYLDDGISMEAVNNNTYRKTTISHQSQGDSRTVRVTRSVDNYLPPEPFYFIALLGTQHPATVQAAGTVLPDVQTPDLLASSPENCYYWNANIEITFIKIFDTAINISVIADYN
jgi:alpha-glucosidase